MPVPEVAPLRSKSLAPVSLALKQTDTLRSCKSFLEDLLGEGQANVDPERLYTGVCDALGEDPKPDLIT